MEQLQQMSGSERQIMEFIWAAERPVTTREILRNLDSSKAWKQSTVITFLTRLIEKHIVKATRVGKANFYEPRISQQEYLLFETRQFIRDVHKGSTKGFLSALCDIGDLTERDIAELIARVKDR